MSATEKELQSKKKGYAFFSGDDTSSQQATDGPIMIPMVTITPPDTSPKKDDDEQTLPFSQDVHFPVEIDPDLLVVSLDDVDDASSKAPFKPPKLNEDLPPDQRLMEIEQCFKTINDDIGNIVDAMGNSSSIITQVANKWGNLHIVAKTAIGITGGIAIIGLGTFGIMAHMVLLPSLVGVTGVVALSTTLLLENHYQMQQSFLTEIKQGFISLASILKMTVMSLAKIREDFAVELTKMKKQNELFEENNKEFKQEVTNLTGTVELLQESKDELQSQIDRQKQHLSELKETSETYKQETSRLGELVDTQTEISDELEKEVKKLARVNQELIDNQKRASEMVKTLNATVGALTTTQLSDESKRKEFLNSLNKMICSQDEALKELVQGFKDTEGQLSTTTEELELMRTRYNDLNECYTTLLEKHEQIMSRHEETIERQEQQVNRLENL